MRSSDPEQRPILLRDSIDPYLQPVTSGSVCGVTGLPLADIWRYFRHTWINHYNSTPGRQVAFLVRDRAARHHPVIGIGAYGSAVVQLSVRDEWIGWTSEGFLKRLRDEPSRLGPWVLRSLDQLVAAIYVDDLLEERVVTKQLLRHPDTNVIQRLHRIAVKARQHHRADPQANEHKAATQSGRWRHEAKTWLFRFKRATMLAKLLEARAAFHAVGFTTKQATDPNAIFKSAKAIQAVRTVLRHTKAAHVGVDMVDITVCGAIAPYGPILGGKLVSLLLAGPQAVQEYERRYKGAVSVIASSMAGKPVVRPPKLVLLGTTSLYGMSSSQYNRLRVPAELFGGESEQVFEYKELGHSTGFGSFHFSTRTIEEVEVLLSQHQDGRPVNSIFGEGVNPKLRKLRSGLEAVGFPADALLRHGDSRLVYGVALATNFRDVLLDLTKRRIPLVPTSAAPNGSKLLTDFWMRRWLAGRIDRPGVLENVASHTLVHPVAHGARVSLPESAEAIPVPQPLSETY